MIFFEKKSEVFDIFVQFKKIVELQLNCQKKKKQIQSDWDGAFRPLSTLLKDNGIIHCLSCPHTYHQNDVIERKHRHI